MLSVVATSRNDDHGGDLLQRMQHFVDGFAEQCRRHNIAAELILVEWNPPPDRPSLAEALRWPQADGPFSIRIIQVPPELHARLALSDRLPLFQMIAKNVGIRRARGDFVLATNTDILFSDALVRFMRDRVRIGNLYRVDRYDVPSGLPDNAPVSEILAFCAENVVRINRRDYIDLVKEGRRLPIYQNLGELILGWSVVAARQGLQRWLLLFLEWLTRLGLTLKRSGKWIERRPRLRIPPRFAESTNSLGAGLLCIAEFIRTALQPERFPRRARRRRFQTIFQAFVAIKKHLEIPRLHTNACGDFTLMSRDDWFALHGYPEWEIFSWHIDSVLLHQAYGNGLRIVELADPMRIYHIEHGIGSGWTPEGEDKLFDRLEKAAIRYLTDDDFLQIAKTMRRGSNAKRPTLFNGENWGFADEDLPEVAICGPQALEGSGRVAL